MATASDVSCDDYTNMKIEFLQNEIKNYEQFSPEKQHQSERILPHVIKSILSYETHDCQLWMSDMIALRVCVASNTSALHYVLRYSNVMKVIIDALPSLAKRNKITLPDEQDGSEIRCIDIALKNLYIFISGSKPDTDMWSYYTKNLDLSALSKIGSKRGGDHFFKSKNTLRIYANIAGSLRVVHNCVIKYSSHYHAGVTREGGWNSKSYTSQCKKHPVSRLLAVPGVNNYAVFCSYPQCGKKAEKDHFTGKCGSCRLTRYCSKQCQVDHWIHGGHKELCVKVVALKFK